MDKLRVQYLDGHELVVNGDDYMCLADRIAFERRFGHSPTKLAKAAAELKEFVNADGELDDADEAGAMRALGQADISEDELTFLAFSLCRREAPEAMGDLSFDAWSATLKDWAIESEEPADPEAPAPANPTEPEGSSRQPESSLS